MDALVEVVALQHVVVAAVLTQIPASTARLWDCHLQRLCWSLNFFDFPLCPDQLTILALRFSSPLAKPCVNVLPFLLSHCCPWKLLIGWKLSAELLHCYLVINCGSSIVDAVEHLRLPGDKIAGLLLILFSCHFQLDINVQSAK